ncbi:hypothetical protein F4823DRAFT_640796 [Ustulina deusta]|nr:hypothetical protein F4823DRAFT_640796 [Ustulina deusta]
MDDKPVFLKAFGEEQFFINAFAYSLDEVKKWMNACCEGKKGGSRTEDETVRALLGNIYNKFLSLIIPDGPEFLKPEPKSHFLRKDDEKWNKDDTTNTVKFDLRRWRDLPFQGVLGKAITVDWWNPYDLLGLFLSILGPAPAGADKTNYFQPLTAVYGQWCSRVGGEVAPPGKVGVGYPPAVFQVTWKKWRPEGSKLADRIDYFLGSSLAGDGWKEKEVGQWRVRVRKARFDMFHDALSVELFSHDDFDPQADGQSFGTCAETYPFIFNVRGQLTDNATLTGLALTSKFIFKGTNAAYNYNRVNKALVGPCSNCQKLIEGSKASVANFQVEKGQSKGPKPPPETTGLMAKAITPAEADATAGTAQQSAVVDPPAGWSIDSDQLDADFYWGTDGDGRAAAQKVGLASPTGQMIVDRHNGGDRYIFTTPDNKVYLWNMITFEVYEFTNPTRLEDILAEMRKKPGQGQLERKLLHDAA